MRGKRHIPIKILDAFTETPFTGNPAGVILDSSGLTAGMMQKIAKELNISITAFLSSKKGADFSIRYFTPTNEIPACGHGTMATFFAWGNENLNNLRNDTVNIQVETGAGVSPVEIKVIDGHVDFVTLTLPNPAFAPVSISKDMVAMALNISADLIESRYPLEIVYDGLYYLVIGVKDRGSLFKNEPSFEQIRVLSNKLKIDAVEVFTLDTTSPSFTAASRTFLPAVGINEDPVCGTGNGALASYLVKNKMIPAAANATIEYVGEQGYSFSRPGIVTVLIELDDRAIVRLRVRGKAVEVLSGHILVG